uniref:Solute carrier family 15 member 1 n=1 Tax=Oncorhynchus mykiss TaxID=8022 RepID=A0A8C7SQ57_ONCMY
MTDYLNATCFSTRWFRSVCGYPLSIFFIVFCTLGITTVALSVLVLYFRYFLRFDDDLATSIYHTFVALCYLTPILGAIVADSWLGKFKTIIYLSIVYAIGQVVMAVSAIHDITDTDRDGTPDNLTFVLSMVGLLLIALGTGGIKPCVAAFGGDQFQDHQAKQRSTFFSVFYLCINGGSLLSTIITPILRGQECGIHSQQKCYPLAFGVPAALMVVALVVFIIGSGMYHKTEPQGNIMLDVCKCIGFAIKNRFRHRSSSYPKRMHWMDWAEEKHEKLLIAQIKMVLKVLFLYIPLPMFWTLFDQKGSRWTLQATTMDGNFTVNPILILTLVPIMDSVVYPLIKKCGLNFTPLRRMTVGMFLAAMAFVAAALVQIQIDVSVYNTYIVWQFVSGLVKYSLMLSWPCMARNRCSIVESRNSLEPGLQEIYIMTKSKLRPFMVNLDVFFLCSFSTLCVFISRFVNGMAGAVNVSTFGSIDYSSASNYSLISNGKATFTITNGANTCEYSREFGFGSSYTLLIPSHFVWGPTCSESISGVEDIQPNSFHMGWQIPQYFLITCGEVVFSVTGLEFSYSQAPSNMKAVLQAGWLFTVAIGNFIVLIVAEIAQIEEQWAEFVLFASLLVAVCVIFSIMAYFYTYMDPAEIEAQFRDKDGTEESDKEELQMQKKDFVDHHNEDDEAKQSKM